MKDFDMTKRNILDKKDINTTIGQKVKAFIEQFQDVEKVKNNLGENKYMIEEITRYKRKEFDSKSFTAFALEQFHKNFTKEEQDDIIKKGYDVPKNSWKEMNDESFWYDFINSLSSRQVQIAGGEVYTNFSKLARFALKRQLASNEDLAVLSDIDEINEYRKYKDENNLPMTNPNCFIAKNLAYEELLKIPTQSWDEFFTILLNGESPEYLRNRCLGMAWRYIFTNELDPIKTWNSFPNWLKKAIEDSNISLGVNTEDLSKILELKSLKLLSNSLFGMDTNNICFNKKVVGTDIMKIFTTWFVCNKGAIPKYMEGRIKEFVPLVKMLHYNWENVWAALRAKYYSNMFEDLSY